MATVPERCVFDCGEIFDNAYRIEKPLGEGSFGAVYKVTDAQNRVYAVKLLKLWAVSTSECQQLRARFTMEFETGRIKSNYLVHSYSYGEVKGNPYMLMEYCPNGDLRKYASHGIDLVRAAYEILSGLNDLHACGKVHRDLKPENVLLRSDYTAVLTDFGISGDRNKRMTERNFNGKPSQVFGTIPYMPPEQVNPPRGQATVLPTTDIFSFGVMFYEMLTGALPFGELREDTVYQYLANGKNGVWDRQRLRRVDSGGSWLPIIEGCLVPDYKQRLQTAAQVRDMLPHTSGVRSAMAEQPVAAQKSFMNVRNGLALRVMQGEEYGKVYYLDQMLGGKHLITMGRRNTDCSNIIDIQEEQSRYISRRHCTLEKDVHTGTWFIRDGQWQNTGGWGEWKLSLNGTYVNSTEVGENGMAIHPGDIISIGDAKLRVEGY